MDFTELKSRLRGIAADVLDEAKNRLPAEEICGFGFFSDESAMTMIPVVNTRTHLNEQIEQDPEDATYFRFYPPEWAEDSLCEKQVDELSRLLADAGEKAEDFTAFRDEVYETALSVLGQMKAEGAFNGFSEDFVLGFAVPDEGDDEEEWVLRLNGPERFNEYLEWLDRQEELDDEELEDFYNNIAAGCPDGSDGDEEISDELSSEV